MMSQSFPLASHSSTQRTLHDREIVSEDVRCEPAGPLRQRGPARADNAQPRWMGETAQTRFLAGLLANPPAPETSKRS